MKILQKIHLRLQQKRKVIKRLKVFYLRNKKCDQIPSSTFENHKTYRLDEFSFQISKAEQT